jgi:hypothetical protein
MRKSLRLLRDCGVILEKRSKAYGTYRDERRRVALAVAATSMKDCTPAMISLSMLQTKLIRMSRRDRPKKDDFIDAINYLALMWECS